MATAPVLRRLRLSEQLASHLTDLIVDSSLLPSHSLPPERELAKQYGVSVGVVREAIRSIAALGLVDVRHGVGTFVNPREEWNTNAPMFLQVQSEPSSVLAVHDVRAPLEVMSAETAAALASPADIAALDQALDAMAGNLEDLEANVNADLNFHLALAHAAHNRILLSVLQSLIGPIHECMVRGGIIVPTAAERALTFHRTIVDAVRAHTPRDARHAMQTHMSSTREELLSLVGGGLVLDAQNPVTTSDTPNGR